MLREHNFGGWKYFLGKIHSLPENVSYNRKYKGGLVLGILKIIGQVAGFDNI